VSAPSVHLERDASGVVTLTLDDEAKKNAMTEALGDRLREAVAALRDDASVRAVVVTGRGDAFSAGGDLEMLERLRTSSFDEARAHMRDFYARYLSLLDVPVPTIAAVRGPAIGAGLCVALACDLLVVDQQAKLAFNFVKLGLHPGMGATLLAPLRLGRQRAAELLYTGRRFGGDEAVRMGLALEAVPAAEVVSRARAIAADIACSAPLAVRALKRGLDVDREQLDCALEHEAKSQAESYASADLGEGLASIRERRAARFSGV
jgi:enoyl-CoA hydratase/carnithine racemase